MTFETFLVAVAVFAVLALGVFGAAVMNAKDGRDQE